METKLRQIKIQRSN